MKPEDVNPQNGWLETAGFSEIGAFIPAHEVGAIIKTAISAGQCYGWLKAFEFTEEQENATRAAHRAWLAKADELEKMK